MNKKGFTLIELLAVIILLGILSSIAIAGASSYLKTSRDKVFKDEEEAFLSAVEGAYADCLNGSANSFCSTHQEYGAQDETVTLAEIVDAGYIDSIKNPYNTDEFCDDTNSYVKVKSNGTVGYNYDITYTVCLVCGSKMSESCN